MKVCDTHSDPFLLHVRWYICQNDCCSEYIFGGWWERNNQRTETNNTIGRVLLVSLLFSQYNFGQCVCHFKMQVLFTCESVCTYMTLFDERFCHFSNNVLRMSPGLDEPGTVVWQLASLLGLAWLLIFLVLLKGVASVGKVLHKITICIYHVAVNLITMS